MNRDAWTWPIVLVLWLFVPTTSIDFSPTPRPIIYASTFEEQHDRAYQHFAMAMSTRHPDQVGRHPVRHVRIAEGDGEPAMLALRRVLELLPVAVVAPTADSARAAARLGASAPVVFASHQHPVLSGIVDRMAGHRTHRMVGISLADEWHAKRMELLREAFPQARTLAVLADRSWAGSDDNERQVLAAAEAQGFLPRLILAESEAELDSVMGSPDAARFDSWYVPATLIAYLHQARIIGHLDRLGAPAMHTTTEEVRSGALMAYAQDTSFAFNAMSDLVARICEGEDPAAIPIEQPRRFLLSVRPREDVSRRRLPPVIVLRADLVL